MAFHNDFNYDQLYEAKYKYGVPFFDIRQTSFQEVIYQNLLDIGTISQKI